MVVKFLRRDSKRFFKFGKGKGKKAKYRKPTGRDNKMREKKKGYAPMVSIGHGKKASEEKILIISNLEDLKNIQKNEIGILGKIGKKKKIEIIKKAEKMKISLKNVNINSFLKKLNKKIKLEKENDTK